MSAVHRFAPSTQCVTTATAGGTADALTIPRLPCLPTTTFLILSPIFNNTSATPTLQAAGDIPRRIVRFDRSPLSPNDLKAGGQHQLTCDGTDWLLMTLAPGVVQVPAATGGLMLIPNGEQTFLDTNGNPLSSGQVFMYSPGTSTPNLTWNDPNRAVQNTNPIILDKAGRGVIWGAGQYRQVVYDQFGNLQWDVITGQDSIFSSLTVNGASTLNGSLTVNGASTFNGLSTFNNGINLTGGGLTVSGGATLDSLAVSGGTTLNGLTVNAAAGQTAALNVNGSLHIVPVPGQTFGLGVAGDVSIDRNLDVYGLASLHAGLDVGGQANFNGNTAFNGTNIFNGYAVFYQGAEVRGIIPGSVPPTTFGVAGNSEFDGTLVAIGITDLSDARIKTDIAKLPLDCLSVVQSIEPKQYRLREKPRYGLIAQDFERVAPHAISEARDGMLGLSLGDLIAVLWGAVRELASKPALQ